MTPILIEQALEGFGDTRDRRTPSSLSTTAILDRTLQTRVSRWRQMALILTAEDVVRRIAAECAYVDERGGVGIRLEPAAAIVRQYGEQLRRAPRRGQVRRTRKPPVVMRLRILRPLARPPPFGFVSDFLQQANVEYQ
jgi:hypothetical protein